MTDLNKIRAAQVRVAERAAIADLPPELLVGMVPERPCAQHEQLPPLPEPALTDQHGYIAAYTAEQMHAYALAAIAKVSA